MSSPFLTTCQPWKLGFELENCITRPLSLSLCFRIVRAKCSAKNGERRRSGRRRGAGGKLCETVRRFPPRRRTLKNSGLLCEKERISPSQINFVHRLFTATLDIPAKSSQFASRSRNRTNSCSTTFLPTLGFNCCSLKKNKATLNFLQSARANFSPNLAPPLKQVLLREPLASLIFRVARSFTPLPNDLSFVARSPSSFG